MPVAGGHGEHRRLGGPRAAGPAERRSSYRLAFDPGVVALDLPGSPSVPVLDVSGDGASLFLPQAALGRSRLPTVLHLNGRHSFGADLELVRHASLDPDRVEVGVRFRGLSHEAWHDLGEFLIAEFLRRQRSLERLSLAPGPLLRVRDEARMAGILRLHGVAQGRPLSVYRGHQPLPVRLRLDSIAPNNAHLEATSDLEDALEPDVSYSFLLPASGAAILFSATARPGRGRAVRLSFPVEMLQGGFRDSLRLPTLHEEGVLVSFPHHRTDGLRRARLVQDVSDQGLSFPLAAGQDLLLPGDRLDDLRVELPTGAVSTRAVIRSVAPRDGGAGLTCGIELLDFEGVADRRRWERYLFSKAYPRTLDEGPDLAGMAWKMLDSSGYLDLWTRAEDRERLERRFHHQWSWPAAVPSHLIVLREESRYAGTFATSRLYPRTWLLHSLGVDKDAGGGTARCWTWLASSTPPCSGCSRGKPRGASSPSSSRRTSAGPTSSTAGSSGRCRKARRPCTTSTPFTSAAPGRARTPSGRGRSLERARGGARRAHGGRPAAARPPHAARARGLFLRRGRDRPRLLLRRGPGGVSPQRLRGPGRGRPRGRPGPGERERGSQRLRAPQQLPHLFLRPVPDRAEVKGICGTLLAAAREAYRARDVREFIIFSTHEAMAEAAFERGSCLISDGVRWVASCELLQAWTTYIDEVLQSRSHELRGPREVPGERRPWGPDRMGADSPADDLRARLEAPPGDDSSAWKPLFFHRTTPETGAASPGCSGTSRALACTARSAASWTSSWSAGTPG